MKSSDKHQILLLLMLILLNVDHAGWKAVWVVAAGIQAIMTIGYLIAESRQP